MFTLKRRSGFAAIELAALAAVAAAVVALLMLVGERQRRSRGIEQDYGKFRQIAALTASYAADNAGRFWGFSWRVGDSPSPFPDFRFGTTDMQTHADQAVTIIRLQGGRMDMPRVTGWLPSVMYSHLPLLVYANMPVPDPLFVSAGDFPRLAWLADPAAYARGGFGQFLQPMQFPHAWKYFHSSSFQLGPAFYDISPAGKRLEQGASSQMWLAAQTNTLRQRRVADVAFPSQKVHLHDAYDWFNSPTFRFFAHPQAKLPLLFVDGHVGNHVTAEADAGWQPNTPATGAPTMMTYAAYDQWLPVGEPGPYAGRYRWTRLSESERGLVGRDFAIGANPRR